MENTIKLKTINPYFNAIWAGKKKSEIRFNHRDFKEGNIITFEEYDSVKAKVTGYKVEVCITYINGMHGVQEGFCMFCFEINKRISPEFTEPAKVETAPTTITYKQIDILGQAITEPGEIDK